MIAAARDGHEEAFRYALQQGADVNAKDKDGFTAFHIACDGGHLVMAQVLLELNAEINTTDDIGNTPLSSSCSNMMLTQLLLKHDADAATRNAYGGSPLSFARNGYNLKIVNMLEVK